MEIAVVNMGAGNVRSVLNALARLGCQARLTDDAELIRRADRVVLPGQGEAANVMAYLRGHGLDRLIPSLTQPVLGICIGMQLMCRHSEEGDTDCLGVMDAEVKRFRPTCHTDKVPQMGWNQLAPVEPCDPLFRGLDGGEWVYYVHSYYVPLAPQTIATTDYTLTYSAALHRDNFWATQFHPEKSGRVGERILENFLAL